MLASFLHLMGFPSRQARAGFDSTVTQGIKRGDEGAAPTDNKRWPEGGEQRPVGAAAARRQEVKPQPKAAAKAQKNKPAAKAKPLKAAAKAVKPAAKAVKVAAKAKPAAKPAAKSAAKPAAKAKPAPKKTPAKAATKPVAKGTKALVKSVAKPAAKSSAKAVKPAAKPAAKPAVKAVKPVAKPAAKPAAKSAAKPTAKPLAKAGAAASKKVAAKPVAKPARPAAKALPAAKKSAAPQPAKAAPKASAAPAAKKSAASPAPASSSTPVAAAPAAAVPGSTPPRATRPSARLVQITVPSMAQSVASTAAKPSYIQTPVPPVPTPPPSLPVKKDPKLANNWKTKTADQLTDAEVMAMPDGEYMNDKQMAFFRLKLQQLKQDILNSAGETTEHLREDTVIVPDPADRATIEEEHALELRTRDRERKLLKKIEQSIARIDAGDYGYCDETGEPIGVGRLLARPTATLSLEAQQRRELKQKMFGD